MLVSNYWTTNKLDIAIELAASIDPLTSGMLC